jgi:hypothetical protein
MEKTKRELILEIIKTKEKLFETCRCSDDYIYAEWEFDCYLAKLLSELE